jgi:hypothetical protein
MGDSKTPFRLLTDDEFDALTTQQRIDYLRGAIAALDEFKGQLTKQIIADTAQAIEEKYVRKAG